MWKVSNNAFDQLFLDLKGELGGMQTCVVLNIYEPYFSYI